MSGIWVIGFIATAFLSSMAAAQDDAPASLSAAFKERALASIKHSDPKKRKSAYRAFQFLGVKSLRDYSAILGKAQLHHQASIRNTMRVRGNPYIQLTMESDILASERNRVMKLIHTDWKKDPGKIRMLNNEMQTLERKYRKVTKLARANSASIDEKMTTAMQALVEIRWELESIDRQSNKNNTSELPDHDDLEDLVIEDIYEAEDWADRKKLKSKVLDEMQRLDQANKYNAASKWANAAQRDFSNQLNTQRAVAGLHPMLLEERLSAASRDHSSDMKTLGFFAHKSPVKGKTNPVDRARLAKFTGRWTGENIFMGSASPGAAYNAWFGSDGHRFIMFTRGGSNVIGVGVVGSHWTMMTGRK
ncbi:MAG: CAP domain-containing protein [Akkermansiaceae bacterium]